MSDLDNINKAVKKFNQLTSQGKFDQAAKFEHEIVAKFGKSKFMETWQKIQRQYLP